MNSDQNFTRNSVRPTVCVCQRAFCVQAEFIMRYKVCGSVAFWQQIFSNPTNFGFTQGDGISRLLVGKREFFRIDLFNLASPPADHITLLAARLASTDNVGTRRPSSPTRKPPPRHLFPP